MSSTHILRRVPIVRSARVMQLEGLFGLPPSDVSTRGWQVDLALPEEWYVGLIVGPSGSGKSTVAREIFRDAVVEAQAWPEQHSVIDAFPTEMGIKEIALLLSSVGFSSPPSWLRPYSALSTGERFRVSVARALAECRPITVIDEFTSVVDRTVAQIGSAAIARAIRSRKQRFIAVSCHYDIIEWLQPDWIYEPHQNLLSRRSLQRPPISLHIQRVHHDAWRSFRQHHYLSGDLHGGATCFCAFWRDTPVAFVATLHMPHPRVKNLKREHRLVCLPDYQGIGIGAALSAYVASMWRGLGFRYRSITSHPGVIATRYRSPLWRMVTAPGLQGMTFPQGCLYASGRRRPTRLRAAFEFVGTPMERTEAVALLGRC